MTIILGYGAHGRDIHAIWNRDKYHKGEELIPYDDSYSKKHKRVGEAPTDAYFVGLNNPIERRALALEYRRWHFGYQEVEGTRAVAVDKTAIIEGWNRRWGVQSGIVIGPNVLMLQEVTIGEHTHINYGVQMTRCDIGHFVTIAPGVTICGDVRIGNDTLIGAGAVISNLVNIGNGCTIGAGAVVVKDVADGETVVGVPARCIKRSTE